MRIQILPLPAVTSAEYSYNPFVVVFDHLDEEYSMADVERLRSVTDSWGAIASIAIDAGREIEISPQLELPEELQQALLARLQTATTKEHP